MSVIQLLRARSWTVAAVAFLVGLDLTKTAADARQNASRQIALVVMPPTVKARVGKPIKLFVFLENHSNEVACIDVRFTATDFVAKPYPNFLMMRCRDRRTRHEMENRWRWVGKTAQDAAGVEQPDSIYPRRLSGASLDLADYYVLPRGDYDVEFQYNTRAIPDWLKPDKLAFHGLSNLVRIRVIVR